MEHQRTRLFFQPFLECQHSFYTRNSFKVLLRQSRHQTLVNPGQRDSDLTAAACCQHEGSSGRHPATPSAGLYLQCPPKYHITSLVWNKCEHSCTSEQVTIVLILSLHYICLFITITEAESATGKGWDHLNCLWLNMDKKDSQKQWIFSIRHNYIGWQGIQSHSSIHFCFKQGSLEIRRKLT